jgi:hypothetical protein
MNKEVSPRVAIAALIVFLGIAAVAYLRYERRPSVAAGTSATGAGGMPPQVSAEIQKRLAKAKAAKP